MDADTSMCAYVRAVMAPLVDEPSMFDVELRHDDDGVTVVLRTHTDATYRQLLGKGGRTAEALRHLVRSWSGAQRAGLRVCAVRIVLPT